MISKIHSTAEIGACKCCTTHRKCHSTRLPSCETAHAALAEWYRIKAAPRIVEGLKCRRGRVGSWNGRLYLTPRVQLSSPIPMVHKQPRSSGSLFMLDRKDIAGRVGNPKHPTRKYGSGHENLGIAAPGRIAHPVSLPSVLPPLSLCYAHDSELEHKHGHIKWNRQICTVTSMMRAPKPSPSLQLPGYITFQKASIRSFLAVS